MKLKAVGITAAISVFAIGFVGMTYVAVSAEATSNPVGGALAAACRKAKADFRPLTKKDVAQAKATLLEALDRLDKRLAQDNGNGDQWRTYLETGTLRELLQRAEPDKAALARIRAHYNSGHDGLDLVWFLDVQKALQNYLATTYAVDNPKIRGEFEKKIDKLAESLDAYAKKPTTEDALTISESLRWLDGAQQVPELVQAIQKQYVAPNLYGSISADILSAGISESIDDTMPVTDRILGTDVQGTAHTVGKTSIELSPNTEMGIIDTLFFGTTVSENVGYHPPVTIFSQSTTTLAARKRLWINANGLCAHPADSKAETSVQINDIQTKKGCNAIEQMAWKRAGKQQCEAEAIASAHAEQRLNERIDAQAAEMLQRVNEAYVEKFYRPFTERKLFPQELKFKTTDKAISVVSVQAGGCKLSAPGLPPMVAPNAEMSLCVHESMINNLAFDALAGKTIYEEKVQAAVKDATGELPEKMKGDDDGKPWAITFAPRQPISVTFADDSFKITIRGVRFCKGTEVHNDPMNITGVYKIVKDGNRFKAVRQGDIQVFPPDFVQGKQLGARQQVIRKLLEKRFSKVFEPEMVGKGFELSGKMKAAGKFEAIQVVCRDGWLVLGWKREATTAKVAVDKK
jgi:hypothetical protein